jgi:malonyl CoA-acyl carrier protein transacylase
MEMREASENTDLSEMVNCKCGFEPNEVGYCGGRSGKWSVSCSNSNCPAVVVITGSKEDCVNRWNDMQSSI